MAPCSPAAEARAEAEGAGDQVGELQCSLDAALTELDIARSLLGAQRQQELAALERAAEGGAAALHGGEQHQVLCFPVAARAPRHLAVSGLWEGGDCPIRCQKHRAAHAHPRTPALVRLDFTQGDPPDTLAQQAVTRILGTCDPNRTGTSAAQSDAGAGKQARQPSPLTRSRMETPATPTASQQPGGALGEEASCSSFGTATPAASAAPSVQQQQQQQEGGAAGRTRPNSATSCFTQPAASVDVADVRQLVVTGGCNTFCR